MPDGQVVFEITGNKKPIEQVLKETTSSIEKETKNWDKAADSSAANMANSYKSAFTSIAAAAVATKLGKVLVDFGKEAISAASDLREVQNVVDVTFGDGAAQIETWAKKAQSQFGLTETQAKRFTSTLGAMMKSSGLAGDEIIGMSTDLAGLAADMASFYNLDFDTAFQKIRAGISGETEPLKQLGINMSVANLEAYALTQGITKAFNQMSQGEQTMLRYQYLMQATADAQGDFARTADGYANAQRRIQTSIESIKTSAGNMLMDVVEPLTAGFASFLEGLTATPEKTVLDEFADIDASTQAKMAEITQTANDARSLVGILNEIQTQNVSNASLTGFVEQLSEKISGLDQAINKAKEGDYAGTLQGIASAMELKTGVDAGKWTNLLTTISTNLPGATSATDSDEQKTAKWLAAAGEAAAKLGGEYPGLWQTFMQTLGSTDTENALAYMANGQAAADAMASLGLSAKSIDGSENGKWSTLLGTLATAEPTKGIFGNDAKTAAKNVKTLSDALSGNDPSAKQEAWTTMLGTLSANAEGVSKLTGTDVESTKTWLEGLAEAANKLDAGDTEGWAQLFTALKEGLPGLELEGTGAEMFAQLSEGFAQLGRESTNAEKALQGLGFDTTDVADKQALWLKVCKELVQTIPGLSSIIDTNTGEIKGGIEAVNNYITEWENANKKMIALEALRAKEEALAAKRVSVVDYELEYKAARKALEQFEEKHAELAKTFHEKGILGLRDSDDKAKKEYMGLLDAAKEAEGVFNEQAQALDEAEEKMKLYRAAVEDMPGDIDKFTDSQEKAAEAVETFSVKAKDAEKELKTVKSALEDIDKYYDSLYSGIERALEGTHDLFGGIETPMDKAKKSVADLEKELDELAKDGKDTKTVELKISGAKEGYRTIENMLSGLQQQATWYAKYNEMLEKARNLGFSDDVLSAVADGTAESFDYLTAITDSGIQKGDARIQQLNEAYAKSASEREELTKALADQTAKTDQAFQSLVESATNAIAGLNLGDEAKTALEATVQGIANGISAKIPEVQRQINALNAVLSQLNAGTTTSGGSGGFTFTSSNGLITAEPLSKGMDYVPFDNYLAALHEGESVLTAEEAKVWRAFRSSGMGSRNAVDYDALGATMRDNVHAGGNVYLDGQTVGRVISARQADSYRALERSGFQS